jgi:hypothetical protein
MKADIDSHGVRGDILVKRVAPPTDHNIDTARSHLILDFYLNDTV